MNIYRLSRKLHTLFRITIITTVLAMVLGPVGSVYAQVVDTPLASPPASDPGTGDTSGTPPAAGPTTPPAPDAGSPVPADPNAAPDALPATDPSTAPGEAVPTADTTDTTPPDASAKTSKTASVKSLVQPLTATQFGGSGAPTIGGQNIFSAQTALPKVDGNTGALTQDIKLDIPPGRNGLQPDLRLQYNSQNSQDGIIGYGWSVAIPYIQRMNRTGTQDLYSTNVHFTSSMDGELATTSTANAYLARVDDGSYRSYSFNSSSNTWTVYDKNGTRYLFGQTSQSQMSATTSPSLVYKWMLEEVRDTNNNYIRYVYTKDGNQIYPSQIILFSITPSKQSLKWLKFCFSVEHLSH